MCHKLQIKNNVPILIVSGILDTVHSYSFVQQVVLLVDQKVSALDTSISSKWGHLESGLVTRSMS